MTPRRVSAALLLAVCAMFVAAPMSALAAARSASPPAHRAVAATSLVNVPIAGKSKSGKKFKGTFTVDRFVSRNGSTYALGTLKGKIGQHAIHRSNVAIPASIGNGSAGAKDAAAASCQILHLVLGPLNLNLLGLHVTLNQVILDITAVPGAGQLLGNLLCDVANLLNGGGLPLQQVTGLLNILQQVLNNPALSNL
jgi:hypothetical protein